MLLVNAKSGLISFHLLFVYPAYRIKLCFCDALCAIVPSKCAKNYLRLMVSTCLIKLALSVETACSSVLDLKLPWYVRSELGQFNGR